MLKGREREGGEGSLASCRQPGNFINCVDTCQIGNTYHHTPPCHPCFVFIWYARKGACKQALIFYWACHNIYDMYLMRVPRLSDATQLLSTVNLMQPITCPSPTTLSLSHSLLLRDNAESLRRVWKVLLLLALRGRRLCLLAFISFNFWQKLYWAYTCVYKYIYTHIYIHIYIDDHAKTFCSHQSFIFLVFSSLSFRGLFCLICVIYKLAKASASCLPLSDWCLLANG